MQITLSEWQDYYSVQESGVMNMWQHPLIVKFAPDGNWQAAFDHFEDQKRTDPLVIDEVEAPSEEHVRQQEWRDKHHEKWMDDKPGEDE